MRDELFLRGDVPMTKREVRALAIDALELEGAHSLVDIGAGTGSVSIQAAVMFPQLQVTAVERVAEGIALIQANAEKFGVRVLTVHAEAPFDLGSTESAGFASEGERFDRVFLGGTGRKIGEILEWIRPHLAEGAILVMTTITIESFYDLISYLRDHKDRWGEIEATQVQASRLEPLGSYTYFKPQNPCQIVRFRCLGGAVR